MRIQRTRRQELLDQQREEYEKNRQIWEQKIHKFETTQKKMYNLFIQNTILMV
jgi:hypothetical protein